VFTNLQLAKIFDIHNIWQQFLYNIQTAVFQWDPRMEGLQHYHLHCAPFREVVTIFPAEKL